jgi:hypothetical protein
VRTGVKHLSREFDRSSKWLRQQLRRKYGRHPVGRNWEWNEREARKIRRWLTKLLNGEAQR